MAYYITNATGTRFGGSKWLIDTSDATSVDAISRVGADDYAVQVKLYACDSAGSTTGRLAGSSPEQITGSGNRTFPVTVSESVPIPAGGGFAVAIVFDGQEYLWYSTADVGDVIPVGTHDFHLFIDRDYDSDNEWFYTEAYFGDQNAYGPDTLVAFGPWSYDLSFPAARIAEFDSTGSFDAAGSKATQGDASFEQAGDADCHGTASLPYGPWPYDLSLPEIVHEAAFEQAADLDAVGTPYVTIATGVIDTTYTDDDVYGGITYRYRITDANGNVVYSNEVEFTPSDGIDFSQIEAFLADGAKGGQSAAEYNAKTDMQAFGSVTTGKNGSASFDQATDFVAAGKKQIRIDADFAQIVAFETEGLVDLWPDGIAEFAAITTFSASGRMAINLGLHPTRYLLVDEYARTVTSSDCATTLVVDEAPARRLEVDV